MSDKKSDNYICTEPHDFAKRYLKEFGSCIIEMLGTLLVYRDGSFKFVVDLKDVRFPWLVKEIHMNNTVIDKSNAFKPFTNLQLLCGTPKIVTTSMYGMFSNTMCRRDIGKWDTSLVTNMKYMFLNSWSIGDISAWDTSSVTSMRSMFDGSEFNGDISGWNTSAVTDMSSMFKRSNFNGDVSQWDTSSVTNMRDMFAHSNFNGDLSNWEVSSKTNTDDMFRGTKYIGEVGCIVFPR